MDLNISISPDIVLSPQLIQKMSILEMDSLELMEYISEAALENPLLETENGDDLLNEKNELLRKKVSWLKDADEQNRYYCQQDSDNETDLLLTIPDRGHAEGLTSHLMAQLHKTDVRVNSVYQTAKYIINCLDDGGYLRVRLNNLAAECEVNIGAAEEALRLIQSFEPAGVAAGSLSECLCLQLARKGETGLPMTIVSEFLEALSKDHYHAISKVTGASENDVRKACDLIRSLDPKPGAGFNNDDLAGYIRPDLLVVIENGKIRVEENGASPHIKINAYYSSLLKNSHDQRIRCYVTEKIRQAQWMIKCLEQRRSTILKCAEYIVERQKSFFLFGQAVKPLLQADVAAALGIHESTVSRAVKGKYLQCKDGVHPMARFFSRPVNKECESDVSSSQTKILIRQFIDKENKLQPYSDQNLSEQLNRCGIAISRRTVAKYREELGIRSTMGRRRV